MILPVDIPQIPESFLEDLIEVHEQQILDSKLEKLPLLVERDGFMEPLIGIYPTSMADFVEDRIKAKRFSVFRMLKEWGSETFVADIPAWQIANINTQEDYKKLLK
jgi:molybdopterin-guanine dinucleotide biosynthesis protein A